MTRHMGEVVHKLAKEKGLKAEDLAPVLKRSVGTVYGLYRNQSIDTDTLFTLSAFLEVPVAEFFGDTYTQVAQVEDDQACYGNKVIDENTVREMQHEISMLKLTIAHKDELLSVYKSMPRN